jgi:toxin-antitoxin system PIN domain toxin
MRMWMELPDINVWLALTFEAHTHHTMAKQWFENQNESGCCFCRMTQSGFLRLATNAVVFGDETLTLSQAWSCYDRLLEDPRIQFAHEPLGLEHLWRRMTIGETYSPKVWNDAYLAAFCISGEFHLVTFDRGFSKFKELECTLLAADTETNHTNSSTD